MASTNGTDSASPVELAVAHVKDFTLEDWNAFLALLPPHSQNSLKQILLIEQGLPSTASASGGPQTRGAAAAAPSEVQLYYDERADADAEAQPPSLEAGRSCPSSEQTAQAAKVDDGDAETRVRERNAQIVKEQGLQTLADVSSLDYRFLEWGDAEAAIVAGVLRSAALPKLLVLWLARNSVGDVGVTSLADALALGRAPALKELYLGWNTFGDAGAEALARMLTSGQPPALETIALSDNQVTDAGVQALAAAVRSGKATKLQVIWLINNRIGEEAQKAFNRTCEAKSIRVAL